MKLRLLTVRLLMSGCQRWRAHLRGPLVPGRKVVLPRFSPSDRGWKEGEDSTAWGSGAEAMTDRGEYFLSRLQFGAATMLHDGQGFEMLHWSEKQPGAFVDQPVLPGKEQRLPDAYSHRATNVANVAGIETNRGVETAGVEEEVVTRMQPYSTRFEMSHNFTSGKKVSLLTVQGMTPTDRVAVTFE
jgi:hypothetical protein